MQDFNGYFTDEIIFITGDTRLRGKMEGKVIVTTNTKLIINGVVKGNVHIGINATVILNGTVEGNIKLVYPTSKLEVYGTLAGKIHGDSNNIYIDRNAITF